MLQITSTTLKVEGVCLGPQQLKYLKAIATERDEQRKRAMRDKEWRGLLDCGQHLFWALSILAQASPFAAPHLSQEHVRPCPFCKTILEKVLVAGQNKVSWRLQC